MPRSNFSWRVSNAQRGAICFLVLAGMGFLEACTIAGVPILQAKAVIPKDWHQSNRHKGQNRLLKGNRKRWHAERLAAAKAAYMDLTRPLKASGYELGITTHTLRRLAILHNWPRRPQGWNFALFNAPPDRSSPPTVPLRGDRESAPSQVPQPAPLSPNGGAGTHSHGQRNDLAR